MDLIQNYYSEEEDDTPSASARSNQPPPDQPPVVQGQSADVQGPSGEGQNDPKMPAAPEIDPEIAKIARKKKKREFRAKIDKITISNQYQCNFCTTVLNRRSINRHIKQKHPNKMKYKWNYTCTPARVLTGMVSNLLDEY